MSRSRNNGHWMTVPAKYKRNRRQQDRQAAKQALAHEREPERERRSDKYLYW